MRRGSRSNRIRIVGVRIMPAYANFRALVLSFKACNQMKQALAIGKSGDF